MDQRNVPSVAYRLWNPNAAAAWGFLLFTPAFSAWLHAINWREIGEPQRARTNMIWVWAVLAYLILLTGTEFVPLPKLLDTALARLGAPLLWLAWYGFEGRVQSQYVVKSLGGYYAKKGWARPLLAAILAIGLYVGLFIAVFVAVDYTSRQIPKTRDPAALSAWVERRILKKWHEEPTLRDATIQKIEMSSKDQITYTGTVDATLAGESAHYVVKLITEGDDAGWRIKRAETPGTPQGK